MSLDMYAENIMDHFNSPRNSGEVKDPDIKHKEFNPFCGDQIELTVKLRNGKEIQEIKFQGKGCSISQASASMLTEIVKNKNIEEVKKLTKEDILDLLNIPIGPVRMKCALLALDTLQNGIKIYEQYTKKK
ncbi:MAG: SUF system NifU family Fe-S cluster assembly protein [Candidatus Aenigmarchaeota archaeon]|nr:SUF system NifU family Fe-S cluster assembly protein [Candidatus Aenigmarchaeota archaeon]